MIIAVLIPYGLGVVLFDWAPDWRFENHPVHAVVEGLGALIAIMIAGLMIYLQRFGLIDNVYTWAGSALVVMGVFDGLHAMLHAGQAFVGLHSLAVFFGGILFVGVWLPVDWQHRAQMPVIGLVAVLLGIVLVFMPDALPVMIQDARFTSVARTLNVVGGAGFLLAAIYFITRNIGGSTLFVHHCLLFGGAALLFDVSSVWDATWWLWHGLRLLAYFVAAVFMLRMIFQGLSARARSEARMRDFAQSASDWFWETGPDLKFTFLSDRAFGAVGVAPDHYLGKTREDIADGAKNTLAWRHHLDTLRRREPFAGFEYSRRSPDGQDQIISTSGVPVFDENGEFQGYRGTATDITRIRTAEQSYRLLFEGANDGIMVRDIESFEIVDCNEVFARMLGYEKEEVIGLPITDVIGLPLIEGRVDRLSQLRPGESDAIERLHKRKDGSVFPVEVSSTVIDRGDRKVVLNFTRDITERKALEDDLRKEQQRLHLAQQVANLGYFERDLKSGETYWSEELSDIFGLKRSEGNPNYEHFINLVHEGDRERVKSAEIRVKQNNAPEAMEYRIRRPDGNVRSLLAYMQVFKNDDGEPVKLVGSIRDITIEKERDEQLRQAQKMEAVGQLTAGIAHDFNNILAGFMGNLDLISDFDSTPEERKTRINRAQALLERGANLTSRLLAFSRKQALQPSNVSVDKQIESMLELMRRTLGERIEIKTHFRPELWPAFVDPNQLENAVLNLAINARDAMPEGGVLSIDGLNIIVDEDARDTQLNLPAGEYVALNIIDNGCGIPSEKLNQVFDPFFTTKDVGQGSGLGLSMVYGFVHQSGGNVTIDSNVDWGTRVTIYLPRATKAAEPVVEVEASKDTPRGRGQRVMVIEDDPEIREVIWSILKGLGYDVIDGGDGGNAIEIAGAQDQKIDLLLSDVVLPHGQSGLDLAEDISRQWAGMKVLLMTGYAEAEELQNDNGELRFPVIEKPFPVADLGRRIGAMLNSV
jgi:PAS domain S-box-containing protein